MNKPLLFFGFYYVFLLDFILTDETVNTEPATEFSKHKLIKIKIYHGREKRQIFSKNEEHFSTDFITAHYDLDNKPYILDLQLNKNLLPKGYFRKYQKDGKRVVEKPSLNEINLCHYHGKVRGIPDSWVAVSTCENGLKGVVFDGHELHHIEKVYTNERNGDVLYYLYRHSDLIKNENKTCGYEETIHDRDRSEQNNVHNRFKRSENANPVRGPYNANKRSRYVELVFVVDNKEYIHSNRNLTKVYRYCKDVANILNMIYSPLNIFIALVGIVVWTERDEITLSSDSNKTLDNFVKYRQEKLLKDYPNDNAHLLTRHVFEPELVGKAFISTMCTFTKSGGITMIHSNKSSVVAATVAHEMGHNFGFQHDKNESDYQCQGHCIMEPFIFDTTHWSSSSLNYLAHEFDKGMDYCLRNKPVSLFDNSICGNGFVESGEQCDCGLPDICDNSCCNATTCMLYTNATCATGECCDLTTCNLKNAGILCRSADHECDLPEYCTGQSEYCPSDVYKMDTEICDNGKAYCYRGTCKTHSDQCKLLWGYTGKSNNMCYTENKIGNIRGNCGYHFVNDSYIKCKDENILCGRLQCEHLKDHKLEFGNIYSSGYYTKKINSIFINCYTARIDFGLNVIDPGLVPNGASCGEGKMCVNQTCMSIENLRAMQMKCPQDCNGNGVCNNLGHCHCKDYFSPPFCDSPGPGGSIDSGPASDLTTTKNFVIFLYITFLGIIPFISIVMLIIYYKIYYKNRVTRRTDEYVSTPQKDSTTTKENWSNNGFNPNSTTKTLPHPVANTIDEYTFGNIPNSTQTTNKYWLNNEFNANTSTLSHPIASRTYEHIYGNVPKRNLTSKSNKHWLNKGFGPNPTTTTTISTISQNVDENTNKNINLDIKQTSLISTTNENLLNNSADNLLEVIPPVPKKRLSIKSIPRLKIDIKLAKQNIKNHIETPKTTETICDDDDFPAISVKKLTNQFQNNAGTSSNT